MKIWVLIWNDEGYVSVESVWSTEELARAEHKRLHPRSILDEPRCDGHTIDERQIDPPPDL